MDVPDDASRDLDDHEAAPAEEPALDLKTGRPCHAFGRVERNNTHKHTQPNQKAQVVSRAPGWLTIRFDDDGATAKRREKEVRMGEAPAEDAEDPEPEAEPEAEPEPEEEEPEPEAPESAFDLESQQPCEIIAKAAAGWRTIRLPDGSTKKRRATQLAAEAPAAEEPEEEEEEAPEAEAPEPEAEPEPEAAPE